MTLPIRRIPHPANAGAYTTREWLVTNGLGGYASGTVSGILTRRYHGLLVAALPAPLGRMVMLSQLIAEASAASGEILPLDPVAPQPHEGAQVAGATLLEFRLEGGLPIWTYQIGATRIEKRVVMPNGQNTVHVTYELALPGEPATFRVRPLLHFRHYSSPPSALPSSPYTLTATGTRMDVSAGEALPSLRILWYGAPATLTMEAMHVEQGYEEEQLRGYEYDGTLWSPGHFHIELSAEHPSATFVASTESWELMETLTPEAALESERLRLQKLILQAAPSARTGLAAELVLAADQFIIAPVQRPEDAARAAAIGSRATTVVAGYHWFTDWGRDTMISLEGLALVTGRPAAARHILETFAGYVRDGLVPNMFPDGEREGLYHTADASLWFFHAVDRYVETTGDKETLKRLQPVLRDIVDHHIRGTRFGIGVDAADGLLRQGAPGYQLTWMDAKVDDWVVTPRRGKTVEINALFYNALRLLEAWESDADPDAGARLREHADRTKASFNERFWDEQRGSLFDLVDGEQGNDASCRPNQILAIALRHAVLDEQHWASVLQAVRDRLLTPYGLRTLAPGEPNYSPKYYGNLRARDAAYHQGTVWAWLIGPFIDAWLRVEPGSRDLAASWLRRFDEHLSEAGVGSVSEIFDAESPYVPRGCIAQAWSVAEVLRAWTRCQPADRSLLGKNDEPQFATRHQ